MSQTQIPVADVTALRIQVAYALPAQQWVVDLQLPRGAKVADALTAVAASEPFASLDLWQLPVGIYGEPVAHEQELADFDRVELYRPLPVDPKQARRQRAAGH